MKGGRDNENHIGQGIMESAYCCDGRHVSDTASAGAGIGEGEMEESYTDGQTLTRAELARRLGVSRTYVTLMVQGKKNPSKEMADRLASMGLTANLSSNAIQINGALSPLTEHTTFNQGVTGSRPVRPTYL